MIRLVTLLSLFLAYAVPAAAQNPDFSGTWTMDEKRSGSPSHETFVGPVVWVIQQTGDTFTLQRRRGTNVDDFNYTFVAKAAPEADRPVKAPTVDAPGHRAHWDADRLVLETHQTIQGKTVTAREVLSLGAGGELTVERVVEVEHGYTMKGAQNFNAVKDVFTKTSR